MKKTIVNWKKSAKKFAEKIWKCSGKKHKTFKAIWAVLGHLTPKIFSVSQPWTSPPLPTILVLLRPWFYKPIKRHPNNINWSSSSVVNFEHVFVRWGIFKSNHSEKLWKLTLLKHLNFQGNMWRLYSNCSVYSKNLKLYEKIFQQRSHSSSQMRKISPYIQKQSPRRVLWKKVF